MFINVNYRVITVFKSSPSQFIKVIYSVEYKDAGKDVGKDPGKDAMTLNNAACPYQTAAFFVRFSGFWLVHSTKVAVSHDGF